MKAFHILFIFILNFKLIFCQTEFGFPDGNFTLTVNGEFLNPTDDGQSVILSNEYLGEISKWFTTAGILHSLEVGSFLVGDPSGKVALSLDFDGNQEWSWESNDGITGNIRHVELNTYLTKYMLNPSTSTVKLSPLLPNSTDQLWTLKND